MARRRAQTYRSSELSELTRQLLYAPPSKRAQVVQQAEVLHDELEPAKNYPIDFIVYRLTQRRVPPSESVMLVGEALRPDLRLLIDELSRSIEIPADPDDPGETTAQLAERLGISTKTVARWRDTGLRWRWGLRKPGDKPVVLIPLAALADYERMRSHKIASASSFSRLHEGEKQRLIDRARRLADATDAPPQAIITHLSRRTGRSPETIRSLIVQHDRMGDVRQVFADRAEPLTEKQKRVIDRAYRAGVAVAMICERYRKTRSTIYRVVHEADAKRVLAIEIELIASPMFERDDADEVILRPIDRSGAARRLDARMIHMLPELLQPAYDRPIDPEAVSRSLLVRYNYLKYRAKQAQADLRIQVVRASDLNRFETLLERANQTRSQIISGLLPSVLSVVRRQMGEVGRKDAIRLLDLLDRGHAVLIEEIERYDPARSHTIESVLVNRLQQVLAKPISRDAPIDAEDLLDRLTRAGFTINPAQDHQAPPENDSGGQASLPVFKPNT